MIISASRRTDIPAFYADWFFDRLREGSVRVGNPFNRRQVRHVDLKPSSVAGIVFWSKNPRPMLHRLHELSEYAFYFLYTLNDFGEDIEPRVPPRKTGIDTFQRLAAAIGPERVIWRYDPIFLSSRMNIAYHLAHFADLAFQLKESTQHCIISFLDVYRRNAASLNRLGIMPPDQGQIHEIATGLAKICRECGLDLQTCAEAVDLAEQKIGHACCVDAARLASISGRPVQIGRDPHQRQACRCSASVDIGSYNTCGYGCIYCYAISQVAYKSRK